MLAPEHLVYTTFDECCRMVMGQGEKESHRSQVWQCQGRSFELALRAHPGLLNLDFHGGGPDFNLLNPLYKSPGVDGPVNQLREYTCVEAPDVAFWNRIRCSYILDPPFPSK